MGFKIWLTESEKRQEEKENKIKNILNGQNLILFFKKDGKVFGAPEESRLIFAKMKTPDEDINADWLKDAAFSAFDLGNALDGDETENLFKASDLDSIQILDKDDAEQILMKKPDKGEVPDLKEPSHDKDGANVIVLKDKK